MTKNTANWDRTVRVLLGLVLVGLFFTETVGLLGLAGGFALIASGALSWCAIYRVLGLSTRRPTPDNGSTARD